MFCNASLYPACPIFSDLKVSASQAHPPSALTSDDQVIDGFTFLR